MFVRDLAARLRTPSWAVLGATLFALLIPFANVSSAQVAGPEWKLTVTPNADYFLSGTEADPGHYGIYTVEAENVGNSPTSAEFTLENLLPEGLSAKLLRFYEKSHPTIEEGSARWEDRHEALCPTLLECKVTDPLKAHQKLVMTVFVSVPAGVEAALTDVAKISGGGAPPAQAAATNAASPNPAPGLLHFGSALTDSSRTNPYTQAGGHPYQFSTEFNFETYSAPILINNPGNPNPSIASTASVGDFKEASGELPPGLLANPQGVPHCSLAAWFSQECEILKDTVGAACLRFELKTQYGCRNVEPIVNLQPQGSYPGELGIPVQHLPFGLITAGLRSGSDYGVTATSSAPEVGFSRIRITLWGVPANSGHDALRGKECSYRSEEIFTSVDEAEQNCERKTKNLGPGEGGPAGVAETPFLTMPTECSGQPLTIVGRNNTWQVPGVFAKAGAEVPAVDGCNQLSFQPTIQAKPTTNLADSPSGLQFDLHVPQNEDPEGVATPSLKEAVVKFPAGLSVNPSSGDGLAGCSEAQVGLHTEEPAHCPDASKLGEVEVQTPLLAEPLKGALYLATPHQNPSGALLAGYIVLEGQGVKVKLPGSFEADPQTGQITAKFLENPQLPFEDFKFNVFGGARGALRTPAVCGSYETTSQFTPYSAPESGPPAEPIAEFETTAGPTGGACANAASEEPNKPVFHAGTETPQAGIYSPFSLKLVRQDGEQEIKGIDTTLPPGLVGKLAGVAECSDAQLAAASDPHHSGAAEQASPSCPLNSEVGTVDVAAGAGPTPLNVGGHAYLAGPYKGAPLSLAIVTPAVAGPFDLGTVVVRTALYVNPETAQIHAVSDPIPTILEGIPLDVRSVTLKMARPNFTLNPTNCEPLSFTGSALSVLNVAAPLTQRFQVGGCSALPFKPKLKLSLKGGTKRAQNPALKAVLTAKPGEANIAKAQVTLPHSEFLDNAHIKTVCTRVQFAANECPAASIYGHARAITPLLEKPLEGPVYLRSSSNKLPDLVAALGGQINVVLDGRVDSVHERLRNSFEAVPDAPVSKFTLEMQGGKKGLLVNSENICKSSPRATVKFTGQNGKNEETNPLLKVRCPKHHKRKHQPRA